MKRDMLWIALAALLVPILARIIWFYPGVPSRPEIATPDYQSLSLPQPPVETPAAAEEVKAMGGIVVVDYAHSNQFQMGEIRSFKEEIERRGGQLELNTDPTALRNSLKYSSAYVIISPSVGFSSLEIHDIRAFAQRGGRLLVLTDATRSVTYFDFFTGATIVAPDVNAVNPLLANFGILVNNDYLYDLVENEGNFRNVYFNEFGKDALTFGLQQVAFYGTHSVRSDLGQLLLLGAESTLSSISDAHNPVDGAAVLSEDGNVAVFGDFTFLTPPYSSVADNATLIANLADFILGGKRTVSLANFPYVFSQSAVQVFPTSEVQMTAELIAALGRLQFSLETVNISMQVQNEEPTGGDKIVLGTFTSTEDLAPYIEPFDLVMEEFSEFVEVSGFGKVGRFGNGILLFEPGQKGNTLVLLANTVDDLTQLLGTLNSGSLEGCVFQGEIGICSIGFGGSFSEATPTEVLSTGEPTSPGSAISTPTPLLTPVPTAGG